jgi:hypothetical protein
MSEELAASIFRVTELSVGGCCSVWEEEVFQVYKKAVVFWPVIAMEKKKGWICYWDIGNWVWNWNNQG